MARVFIDGFESGSFDLWNSSGPGSIAGSPPTGMSGSYSSSFNGGTTGLFKILDTSKTELYFSLKIYITNSSTEGIIQFYDSNGTVILSFLRQSSGSYFSYIRLGNYVATIIATGTIPLVTNTVYLVEFRYKPLNSGGIFTTKINGVQDIDYSGDTTNGLESTNSFQMPISSGSIFYGKMDDVVIDDANWIGNTKIQAIVPTGAGATTGWTPSTGANYTTVDEKPASDTDYIKTSSGQTDTYAMGNLAGSIASIKSVAVQSRNWREGNGTYDRGQHIVRPASTDRLAAAKTSVFPITATGFQSIWELNPEDSAAWEEADVNGMEAGIKAVEA